MKKFTEMYMKGSAGNILLPFVTQLLLIKPTCPMVLKSKVPKCSPQTWNRVISHISLWISNQKWLTDGWPSDTNTSFSLSLWLKYEYVVSWAYCLLSVFLGNLETLQVFWSATELQNKSRILKLNKYLGVPTVENKQHEFVTGPYKWGVTPIATVVNPT